MSINYDTISEELRKTGARTYRSLTIEGEEFEFSGGFNDLHTKSYEAILNDDGFELSTARSAIEMVHQIRHQHPVGLKGDYHPLAKLPLIKHPFEK